jgi:superfamily II DNA/RNA helicase
MIHRRAFRLEEVKLFVLDEADEMLSRGFKEQIYDVFKYMPENIQCTIFSATMRCLWRYWKSLSLSLSLTIKNMVLIERN